MTSTAACAALPWWDSLPAVPTHRVVRVARMDVPTCIDALRARPAHAREVLLRAGYSFYGPDLVLETASPAATIIVRGSGVFLRVALGTEVERHMTGRPERFLRQRQSSPRKGSRPNGVAEFEVGPHTIFGSLYYQPECEYPHGFRSLAEKIVYTDNVICKFS